MSGIDFTTRDGSASVRGAERPYGAALAARLTAAILELDGQRTQERNRRILPDIFFRQAAFNDQSAGCTTSLTDAFTYWAPMSGMMYEDGSADIRIGDKTERPDGFVINTAVVAGSDPIALLTRIHAYSEEGLLVTGPDRSWLAGIIDAGLQAHILRDKSGWEGAAELLRSDSRSPALITTSQGVSLSWLQGAAAGFYADGQTDQERWAAEKAFDALSGAEQWDRSISALLEERRPDASWWLMLDPETFHKPSHLGLLTAFDAIEADTAAQKAEKDRRAEGVVQ